MTMRNLTPEQLADAGRLRELVLEHQRRLREAGKPSSQEDLAAHLDFNQSSLAQYIGGKIPLNQAALFAFCSLLRVSPFDISPTLAAAALQRSNEWLALQRATGSPYQVREPDSPFQAAISLTDAVLAIGRRLASADQVSRDACAPLLRQLAIEPGEAASIADTIQALLAARSKRAVA